MYNEDNKFRIEKDSLGEKEVPANAYYGIQSLRAKENFNITKTTMHKELIKALAQVKKAAFLANNDAKLINDEITEASIKACDELYKGKFNKHIIVDQIQGGAGTSMNMNINEIIANRGNEILNKELGKYDPIHPNDHCNFGQSTNDVVPTAGKIASLNLTKGLIEELKQLIKELEIKEEKFKDIVKMGRTHLQDAIPITFGQQISAYKDVLKRDLERLKEATKGLKVVNMGATAVGTGLNASIDYMNIIAKRLNEVTNEKYTITPNLIDGTRNLDGFLQLSASLKILAVNLSKTANDFRMMASGPTAGLNEIYLPKKQPGSSIMPGKVNPVIPEVLNQVCFQVLGNDLVITKAAEAGQLELNVFEPVLFKNLLESLDILTQGIKTFKDNAIKDLEVNEKACRLYVENSIGIITALAPHLGYETCSRIAKKALNEKITIAKIILEENLMSKDQLELILNVTAMTTPGIASPELIKKDE